MSKKTTEKRKGESQSNLPYYILLFAGILFSVIVRVRFLNMPLERDEGHFATVAQQILKGESPFFYYNFKLPGTSYIYAFFMLLFGQTITAIHAGALIV